MPKAKALTDITLEDDNDIVTNVTGQTVPITVTASEPAPEPASKPPARHSRAKQPPKKAAKGISSSSPTVYLTPDTKQFLSKYKSYLVLSSGITLSDNAIISMALAAYIKKEDKEFYDKHKTLLNK